MASFIESIPTNLIKKRDAINYRNVDLRSKFYFGCGFTSYNGANMGLMDAYNAILDRMFMLIVHLLLLLIEKVDHQQVFEISLLQRDAYSGERVQQFVYGF